MSFYRGVPGRTDNDDDDSEDEDRIPSTTTTQPSALQSVPGVSSLVLSPSPLPAPSVPQLVAAVASPSPASHPVHQQQLRERDETCQATAEAGDEKNGNKLSKNPSEMPVVTTTRIEPEQNQTDPSSLASSAASIESKHSFQELSGTVQPQQQQQHDADTNRGGVNTIGSTTAIPNPPPAKSTAQARPSSAATATTTNTQTVPYPSHLNSSFRSPELVAAAAAVPNTRSSRAAAAAARGAATAANPPAARSSIATYQQHPSHHLGGGLSEESSLDWEQQLPSQRVAAASLGVQSPNSSLTMNSRPSGLLRPIASGRSLSSHSGHSSRQVLAVGTEATQQTSDAIHGIGVGGGAGGDSGGLSSSWSTRWLPSGGNQYGPSKQGGPRRQSYAGSSSTTTGSSSTNSRFAITARIAQRSERIKTRVASGQIKNAHAPTDGVAELLEQDEAHQHHPHVIRRYRVGDYVLVCNQQSRWANLVNKHGFPPGEGQSPEERSGPYIYVLATVKKVHFEEIQTYYTVTRMDTGADQRADVEYMEPIRSDRGENAAIQAATSSMAGPTSSDRDLLQLDERAEHSGNQCTNYCMNAVLFLLLPFLWLYDCFYYLGLRFVSPLSRRLTHFARRQAYFILNGLDPYVFRLRLTCVNLLVVCSTWLMFIDQVRLAFFPPTADYALAWISLCVWVILVLELIFEVFIRPDGYEELICSDKAYSPTTIRYINAFHLTVETISLGVFVPEFYCLLTNTRCDERLPFSFYNAALIGVIGPTHMQVFYGRAFFALIRLRVFGLVRHWRNMWIANTFINMKWKTKRGRGGGWLSYIIPHQVMRTSLSDRKSSKSIKKKKVDAEVEQQRKRDATLTNASTIGTALMATNSYRALGILWVIIGVFPIIFTVDSLLINPTTLAMTNQMQMTNTIASSTASEDCTYLGESIWSWMAGVAAPNFSNESSVPFLLTFHVTPQRCPYQTTSSPITSLCDNAFKKVAEGLNISLGLDPFATLDALPPTNRSVVDQYNFVLDACGLWSTTNGTTPSEIADSTGLRAGSILLHANSSFANLTNETDGTVTNTTFEVAASFDMSYTIGEAALSSLLLQLCLLIGVLGGLSVLRRDAEVLVLGPLRRMLKRVAQYAKNPLAQPTVVPTAVLKRKLSERLKKNSFESDSYSSDSEVDEDELALGSYETEQLITAVTKITDLLRKCWGVAGADIISTNLASREGALTEVFNPTVPGKSVYALFGFAAINGFDHALHSLGGDVMILINDVAAVLHGEVYRWGFGDSGQCNKNLGSAFLMVFRIGLVKEVIEKLEQATDVVFSTGTTNKSALSSSAGKRRNATKNSGTSSSSQSVRSSRPSSFSDKSSKGSSVSRSGGGMNTTTTKRKAQRTVSVKAMSLSLQSLPGISTFTDRAVIGMLKSYAGIYRDKKIRSWNQDIRLGFGVGAFEVSMIYGMDAGWAVEGAVGSEYKIDATYLSPHVNMASRMMGACKQYNVSFMLSQAVQELMSDVARSKLRHLDTVTVKGSSVRQKIYTYDARNKGVDFFLYSRSDDQADFDADRYSPQIWNNDQDLRAMRQHISDEFVDIFNAGRKAYLSGDWAKAMEKLERANEIMVETAFEDGYLEDEFEDLQARVGGDVAAAEEELKLQNGDGPSLFLLNFMKQHGGVAPPGWEGWHPLTRK